MAVYTVLVDTYQSSCYIVTNSVMSVDIDSHRLIMSYFIEEKKGGYPERGEILL